MRSWVQSVMRKRALPSGWRGAEEPQTATEGRTGNYLEARDWIVRSKQQCQCASTARFLEMIERGIRTRLHDLQTAENAGEGC
jgi:hypothetical protein